MKATIDRKRYDTETAREIARYSNGLGNGDFRNVSESLYVTKNGNYFLSGSGGAMTKYSEGNGNSTWGSSAIIPMTREEAYEWCERHGQDVIDAEFPDMIQEA